MVHFKHTEKEITSCGSICVKSIVRPANFLFADTVTFTDPLILRLEINVNCFAETRVTEIGELLDGFASLGRGSSRRGMYRVTHRWLVR